MIKTFHSTMGPDGDELHLKIDDDDSVKLSGIGCPELLRALPEWRARFRGDPQGWPAPLGDSHVSMMLRELALKAKNEWAPPLEGAELCHCRAVSREDVDLAILRGAHTTATVGAATGAGTQCGTCRPDIQDALHVRLCAD